MTFRIHYELPSGEEDSVIISGETIEEIRTKADNHLERVGADTESAWSEQP